MRELAQPRRAAQLGNGARARARLAGVHDGVEVGAVCGRAGGVGERDELEAERRRDGREEAAHGARACADRLDELEERLRQRVGQYGAVRGSSTGQYGARGGRVGGWSSVRSCHRAVAPATAPARALALLRSSASEATPTVS